MSPAPTAKGTRSVPGGGRGFGAAGSGGRRTPRPPAKRAKGGVPFQWVVVIVVVVFALIIGLVVQSSRSSAKKKPLTYPPASVTGTGYSIVEGQKSAPVSVEEYGDFQCPICREFHSAMDSMLSSLVSSGTIRFAFHPLAFLDRNGDTASLRSASASVCAAIAGKFPEYHNWLYDNQFPEGSRQLTDKILVADGGKVGISGSALTEFTKCVSSGTYEGWVQRGTDAASRRGVTGTPTVFLDGHQLDSSQYTSNGNYDPALFKSTIENVAASSTKPSTTSST